MSYRYRSTKRKCAHFILKNLVHAELLKDNPSQRPENVPWYTIANLSIMNSGYTTGQITWAVDLLAKDKFVTCEPNNQNDKKIFHIVITDIGIDAFYEGHYIVKNREDFLTSIEFKTKWLIPIISLLFSIAAFGFSIYTFLHPHK